MGFLDTVALGERGEELRAKIRKAPPGLELSAYWQAVAGYTPDSARRLLSYLASALMSRGWLQPVDNLLEAATETLMEPAEQVKADFAALCSHALITAEGGKVLTLAGLLATKPTGYTFKFDSQHQVHVLGPLAALCVSKALQKPGEVLATCGDDKKTKLLLRCDVAGVEARDPEEVCAFLPRWDGTSSPTEASLAGALLRDDDALGRWQTANGDPDGMPLMAMLFGMAAADIADQMGAALESVLNHLPDFN